MWLIGFTRDPSIKSRCLVLQSLEVIWKEIGLQSRVCCRQLMINFGAGPRAAYVHRAEPAQARERSGGRRSPRNSLESIRGVVFLAGHRNGNKRKLANQPDFYVGCSKK